MISANPIASSAAACCVLSARVDEPGITSRFRCAFAGDSETYTGPALSGPLFEFDETLDGSRADCLMFPLNEEREDAPGIAGGLPAGSVPALVDVFVA